MADSPAKTKICNKSLDNDEDTKELHLFRKFGILLSILDNDVQLGISTSDLDGYVPKPSADVSNKTATRELRPIKGCESIRMSNPSYQNA